MRPIAFKSREGLGHKRKPLSQQFKQGTAKRSRCYDNVQLKKKANMFVYHICFRFLYSQLWISLNAHSILKSCHYIAIINFLLSFACQVHYRRNWKKRGIQCSLLDIRFNPTNTLRKLKQKNKKRNDFNAVMQKLKPRWGVEQDPARPCPGFSAP